MAPAHPHATGVAVFPALFLRLLFLVLLFTLLLFFSRGHATLHLAMSVGMSVCPSHFLIRSGVRITAPVQLSATGLPCTALLHFQPPFVDLLDLGLSLHRLLLPLHLLLLPLHLLLFPLHLLLFHFLRTFFIFFLFIFTIVLFPLLLFLLPLLLPLL